MPEVWIPTFYAVAMAVDAVAALVFGRLYDHAGLRVVMLVVVLSALFSPLVFLGGAYMALLGMALWGMGLGAQESIMRAAVAGMVAAERRGTAYGVFTTGYGIAWFLGSAAMGILYDVSVPALVFFSVVAQLLSLPLLFVVAKASTPNL